MCRASGPGSATEVPTPLPWLWYHRAALMWGTQAAWSPLLSSPTFLNREKQHSELHLPGSNSKTESPSFLPAFLALARGVCMHQHVAVRTRLSYDPFNHLWLPAPCQAVWRHLWYMVSSSRASWCQRQVRTLRLRQPPPFPGSPCSLC